MSIIPKFNNLAIVQARCSSSRLPRKVLSPILGKPMIVHELERLQRSQCIDKIILATSTDSSDDPLVEIAESIIEVYRGNLDDVLDRYYQCAKLYQPENVVRITGDCPVIDWRIVDKVIGQHLEEGNDYTSLTERFPDGLDTEVFKFAALERAWREAKLNSEREHVTLYIRKHPEIFKLGKRDCAEDFSAMRWTVDEPQDFEFIQKIFAALYPQEKDFGMKDILQLLDSQPELKKINAGIQRNEGLQKSLKLDELRR
ncbi:MAG: glycosyltransferase family protein [Selenomonadaceae bacterium]|nr:glycosyltransferase family protein [Selenomonadaceae bacterium]